MVLHGNVSEKARLKAREGINEGIKFDVFRLILEKPGCRVPFLTKALSVSRATVERAVAALIIIGKIEHRGSKKTGGYYVVSGKESVGGLV
jgi:predicted transcriptional regulator